MTSNVSGINPIPGYSYIHSKHILTTHLIYEVFQKKPKESQPSWDFKEFYKLFRSGHKYYLFCKALPDTLWKTADLTKFPACLPWLIFLINTKHAIYFT